MLACFAPCPRHQPNFTPPFHEESELGREQGGGRMSGRAFPPFATTDPRETTQCRWPQRFAAAPTLSSLTCSARASMTTATLSSGSSRKPTARSSPPAPQWVVEEGPGQGFPRDRLPEHRPADEARARRDHHLHGRQLHHPRRSILGGSSGGPVREREVSLTGSSRGRPAAPRRPDVFCQDYNCGRK